MHVDYSANVLPGRRGAARHHAAGGHLSSDVGRGHARSLDRRASPAVRARRWRLAPIATSQPADAVRPQVIVAVDHCLLWNDDLNGSCATVCRATGSRAPPTANRVLAHARRRADGPAPRRSARRRTDRSVSGERWPTRSPRQINEALRARSRRRRSSTALAAARWPPIATFGTKTAGSSSADSIPPGAADDTCSWPGSLGRSRRRSLATVVNYACHPTTLAWDNTLISPDYVGAMREVVEARDRRAPCVFLQGASGDLGPRHGFVGDVAVADRNGRESGLRRARRARVAARRRHAFEYTGPLISGATIGTWRDRPLARRATVRKTTLADGIAGRPPALSRRPAQPRNTEEEIARLDARRATRLSSAGDGHRGPRLPRPDRTHGAATQPAAVAARRRQRAVARRVWRLGDALWVFVAGEHYQISAAHAPRAIPRVIQ